MMKAALIHKYEQKELAIEEVPLPTIHDNDVLVKIIAASINPIDLKTKDGKVKMLLNYQMPLILGSDFAGIVVSVGKKVQNFRLGDAVYGRVPKNRVGTFAEYIAVDQAAVAMKPKNLKVVTLSGIPNERFAKEYGLPLWKQWAFKIATRKIHRLEQATDVSYHFLFMHPDGEQLALLTEFIEQGKLQPIIDRVIPFSQIQEAVDYSLTGRVQGKIVVKIADVDHD